MQYLRSTAPIPADIDAAAARLFAVLTHHTQLGFAGALLYDHGAYADALRHHPLLASFAARGRLVIVPWGGLQGGAKVPAIASQVLKQQCATHLSEYSKHKPIDNTTV